MDWIARSEANASHSRTTMTIEPRTARRSTSALMCSRDSTANFAAPETTRRRPGTAPPSKALRTAARARIWPSMSAPPAVVVATSTARGALRETQTP